MTKKTIFVVLLLCGSAWAAHPTWNACVSFTGGSGTTLQSCSLTVSQNHIVIIAGSFGNVTATFSETAFSLTPTIWIPKTAGGTVPGFASIACFFTGTNSGADTFKISLSGSSTFSGLYAVEETDGTFTSCAAALDSGGTGSGVATGSGSGSGIVTTSTTMTSTVNNDVLFALCSNNGGTLSAGNGFSSAANSTNGNASAMWTFGGVGVSGTAVSGNCNQSGNNSWIILTAMLKPSTNSGPGPGVFFWQAGSVLQSSGTGGTVGLPGGMQVNDYVICAAAPETRPNYSTQGFSAISGWTSLLGANGNGGVGVWGQLWQSGQTLTFASQQNNGFYEAICVAYGGVNTSTPVDMVNDFNIGIGPAGSMGNLPVPPVFPSWTTDMLVGIFAELTNGNDFPNIPAGMNSRYFNGSIGLGPFVAIGDVLLSSASPTAITSYISTQVNAGNNGRHSIGILLLPASGGSSATRQLQPTEEAISIFNGANTTDLYPVVGDTISVQLFGTNGSCATPPAGYSAVYNTNDMAFFTHVWTVSDTTGSLGGFGCPSTNGNTYVIHNSVNPATSPQVFSSGTSTHGSTTSDASPSIATIANGFLLVEYSAGNSTTPINGAFTMPGGLFTDAKWTASSTTTAGSGSLQAPSNPTGAFTATNSVSGTQNSGAVDFCIVCSAGGVPRHKAVIF